MNAKLISSSTFDRFWQWLQQQPAAKRWGLLLIACTLSGIGLERLAKIYESAWQVSPWDPASALYITVLLALGTRCLPIVLLSSWISSLVVNPGYPWLSLLSAILMALGSGSACYLLKRCLHIDPRLYCWRDAVWFALIAGLLAPLILAVVYITTLVAANQVGQAEWTEQVLAEWAGEATGVMMLAPVLLILLRAAPWNQGRLDLTQPLPQIETKWPSWRQWLELLLAIGALSIACWAAYGIERSNLLNYAYIIFLPLIWVAARRGFVAGISAVLFINLVSVILVGSKAQGNEAIALQFGLMATSITGLLLGATITEQQGTLKRLRYRANHDSLTGLYNRTWFLSRLNQVIAYSRKNDARLFAVLFLDLDRFKVVNDSLGHQVGDWLLIEIARQLQLILQPHSQIARIGGDEFIVLLEYLESTEAAITIAEQLCQRLAKSYTLREYKVFTSISLGLTLSSHGYAMPEDMLRDADIALYQAKARGKNQYAVFDRAMYDAIIRRSQLEQDLRQAIETLDV